MGIEAGQVIAERYRLERKLSQGGMGSVWLAHHLQLNTAVAIKFMHESIASDPQAIRRFEREAKASAKIHSPHVVHIYDHGVDGDLPFLVMQFLRGEDLRARFQRDGGLSPYDAVRICEQVCKGLEKAHDLQIVHRDLKPGNIFLSSGEDDMVTILDFGIAKETGFKKVVESEQTETGKLLGSPHYMSPEQATSETLDGRSDLWSLAVIMFRALTASRPFPEDDLGSLIIRICVGKPLRVSQLRPEMADMDVFFERAFERDPECRFQDAREFSGAFKRALAGTLGLNLPDESEAWAAVSRDSMSFSGGLREEPTMTSSSGLASAPSLQQLKSDDEAGTLFDTSLTLGGSPERLRNKRMALGGLVAGVFLLGALLWVRGGEAEPNGPSDDGEANRLSADPPRGHVATVPPGSSSADLGSEPTAVPSATSSAGATPSASADRSQPPRPSKTITGPTPRPPRTAQPRTPRTPPPSAPPKPRPRPRPRPDELDITDY